MIAIIDYGVGNLFSLQSSFAAIGEKAIVTGEKEVIAQADKIVLPGVGAFCDAANKLRAGGLDNVIKTEVQNGKPLLGICLGMQLLFEKSFEYGEHEGLGLLHGSIMPIASVIPHDYKIPHIGWNPLRIVKKSPLFSRINDGDCVYFVHSFYAAECEDSLIAYAEYGANLTAAVGKGHIYGCQFHPEKSGEVGLQILKSFCEESL